MNTETATTWPFAVRPLTENLGAELSDIDLAGDVSDEVFRAIYRAFLRYQVLVFPPVDLPPDRQVALARHFGEEIGRAHV